MEVMTIRLELDKDNEDHLRVITDTPNTHRDHSLYFGKKSGEMDGYPEAADAVRNYLLGVIADVNWRTWIERL